MSLVFAKCDSQKRTAVALLAVRIGMAFGFLWPGISKVTDPAGFGSTLQNVVGISPSISTEMAMLIGILHIISATLVLSGLFTRPAAIYQAAILIGAMAMFGFDFTAGPAIWKDPTMLGVAVGLLLYGPGRFGIDHLIAKRIQK